MMRLLFTAVMISMFGLASCQQQDEPVKTVGVEEFENLIQDTNVQLVDVRTPEEFAEGHLKGFTMIDVKADDFAEKVDEMLTKDLPVAVYCRSGKRSLTAAEILKSKGFKTVYNLEAGYLSWTEAGKPVVK